MIHIRDRELIALYLMLKREDDSLDETLTIFMNRMEAYLYQKLSIDQMENLEELYEKKIDVLG